ncbi:type II toxin-antitoxin system YhaV family toxin [Metapseudomonas otitidis]|uniref:type II toxin-antitoxin system YhaV family toxin n=1 Tax=Metapseudomonas otitidis TaxID=319939 RepID=UPI00262F70F2|nr:type II toxin-antitoxin system YhaV family toxin [Pseudomonas otitidis]
MRTGKVTVVNDWALFAHPHLIQRLDALVADIEALILERPDDFERHPLYKLFEKVDDALHVRVPADPGSRAFYLGNTLGKENRHWRRVKEGLPNRYRLFFQYHGDAPKRIIYVWLNDEATLRKDGARTDVYVVFRAMLDKGAIPSTFKELLAMAGPLQVAAQEPR